MTGERQGEILLPVAFLTFRDEILFCNTHNVRATREQGEKRNTKCMYSKPIEFWRKKIIFSFKFFRRLGRYAAYGNL
jgi:hypothetical protein